MAEMLEVDDTSFRKEVLESPGTVLVDFWATWCAPCKQMSQILDGVVEDYRGKVKMVKLNVDEGTDTASQYGITAVPTVIIFKDGREVSRMVGVVSRQKLMDKLNSVAGS